MKILDVVKRYFHKDPFLDPAENPLLHYPEINPYLVSLMHFSVDEEMEKFSLLFTEKIEKSFPGFEEYIKKEKNGESPSEETFFKEGKHPHENPFFLLQFFCFTNIYYRTEATRRAIIHLIMKLEFIPIPVLIRSIFELWAAIDRVEKEFKEFINSDRRPEDWHKLTTFARTMAYGMRFYPEFDGKKFPNPINAINVLTLIEQLDRRYPTEDISEKYNFLSEYCHPNAPLPLSTMMGEMVNYAGISRDKIGKQFIILFAFQLSILLMSLDGIKDSLNRINEYLLIEFQE